MIHRPLASLLQATPLPAVLIGPDERIIAANQAVADLLGGRAGR